jgi:hypothetical protein
VEITELQKLQDIFIEEQDWEEVSKIQYEIDNLPEDKKIKPVEFELWFRILVMENFLKTVSNLAEEILEIGNIIQEAEKRKGTKNEK